MARVRSEVLEASQTQWLQHQQQQAPPPQQQQKSDKINSKETATRDGKSNTVATGITAASSTNSSTSGGIGGTKSGGKKIGKASKNGKPLKGKAAAAATALFSSNLFSNDQDATGSSQAMAAGLNTGSTGSKRYPGGVSDSGRRNAGDGQEVTGGRGFASPVAVAEALFARGSVESGVRAALDGEAMALKALVPARWVFCFIVLGDIGCSSVVHDSIPRIAVHNPVTRFYVGIMCPLPFFKVEHSILLIYL